MDTCKSLTNYFASELRNLKCSDEVRAYIVSVLSAYRFSEKDLSNHSITVEYAIARNENDFQRFQTVGDYLFFANSFVPESLNGASSEYYQSVAQLSYYSCYRLMNRQWRLYEQMADRFIDLSQETRQIIRKF